MARKILASFLMLLGPLGVWNIRAHFFDDFGPHRDLREAALIGFAIVVAGGGALLLGWPFSNWSKLVKLAAYAVCGVALALVLPILAFAGFCWIGSCS